jgi:hypothetical protein
MFVPHQKGQCSIDVYLVQENKIMFWIIKFIAIQLYTYNIYWSNTIIGLSAYDHSISAYE